MIASKTDYSEELFTWRETKCIGS